MFFIEYEALDNSERGTLGISFTKFHYALTYVNTLYRMGKGDFFYYTISKRR